MKICNVLGFCLLSYSTLLFGAQKGNLTPGRYSIQQNDKIFSVSKSQSAGAATPGVAIPAKGFPTLDFFTLTSGILHPGDGLSADANESGGNVWAKALATNGQLMSFSWSHVGMTLTYSSVDGGSSRHCSNQDPCILIYKTSGACSVDSLIGWTIGCNVTTEGGSCTTGTASVACVGGYRKNNGGADLGPRYDNT
jgi:hypothetical protein